MIKFDEYLGILRTADWSELIDIRKQARLHFKKQEQILKTEEKVFMSGGHSKYAEAQRDMAYADLYLKRVEEEIENRPVTMQNHYHIPNNQGVVQTGDNSNITINGGYNMGNSSVATNVNGDHANINASIGNTGQHTIESNISNLTEQLSKLGVASSDIKEMEGIARAEKNKTSYLSKAFAWLTKLSGNVVEKIVTDNIPLIMKAINDFAETL